MKRNHKSMPVKKPVWSFRSEDQGKSGSQGNLSFSFRLHDEDGSSDSSEGNKLTIDIKESDSCTDNTSCESPNDKKNHKLPKILQQMEGEIERQLDLKTEKSNLTVLNVKKILKVLITDKDVISMVRQSGDDKTIEVPYGVKLTRAKARELMEKQCFSAIWPLKEVGSTPHSKCQALIDKEFSEDSSDEEYHPGDDEPSDDDELNKSRATSLLDEVDMSEDEDEDEDFGTVEMQPVSSTPIPEEFKDVEPQQQGSTSTNKEKENIGQRTRSKLCLQETPLETIEQAFVPPDITCDMYDWNCDNDDWSDFLKEFVQPLNALPDGNETADDVDADPEYNVLADEDKMTVDKEELRADRGVMVSRKELNDLMNELYDITEMYSVQEKEKKKLSRCSPWNTTLVSETQEENTGMISREQQMLINQQLCQHVQLSAQHFLQTYKHPVLHFLAPQAKLNVVSLHYLSIQNPKSPFKINNLDSALLVMEEWEKMLNDPESGANIIKFMENEVEESDKYLNGLVLNVPKFPPELLKLMSESKAFMYPLLLPPFPFYVYDLPEEYVPVEVDLLVLGLSQFIPYIKQQKKMLVKSSGMFYVAELLSKLLLPAHSAVSIAKYISLKRKAKKNNPIKDYCRKCVMRSIVHYIIPIPEMVLLKNHPKELLPYVFREYLYPNEKNS